VTTLETDSEKGQSHDLDHKPWIRSYGTSEKGIRLFYIQNKIDEVAPISYISKK